ncbi:MAG: hypothetical protein ACRBCT_01755 [Alphaproteobacteria bacterium]
MADKEQKTIYNIYGLFGVTLALSIVPTISAASICLVFFLVTLIAAYVLRGRAEENSLIENHMTYVIRTVWIVSLLSVVTVGLATLYMLPRIDYTAFQSCADAIAGQGVAALEAMGMAELQALTQPCVSDFVNMNHNTLLMAALIGGVPLILYMGYRFAKGVSRAAKGYRLANPKSWV